MRGSQDRQEREEPSGPLDAEIGHARSASGVSERRDRDPAGRRAVDRIGSSAANASASSRSSPAYSAAAGVRRTRSCVTAPPLRGAGGSELDDALALEPREPEAGRERCRAASTKRAPIAASGSARPANVHGDADALVLDPGAVLGRRERRNAVRDLGAPQRERRRRPARRARPPRARDIEHARGRTTPGRPVTMATSAARPTRCGEHVGARRGKRQASSGSGTIGASVPSKSSMIAAPASRARTSSRLIGGPARRSARPRSTCAEAAPAPLGRADLAARQVARRADQGHVREGLREVADQATADACRIPRRAARRRCGRSGRARTAPAPRYPAPAARGSRPASTCTAGRRPRRPADRRRPSPVS